MQPAKNSPIGQIFKSFNLFENNGSHPNQFAHLKRYTWLGLTNTLAHSPAKKNKNITRFQNLQQNSAKKKIYINRLLKDKIIAY